MVVSNDKTKLDVCVRGQCNIPNSSHMWIEELHLDGWMLAGCKLTVIKFCLTNKEKALRSVLAITHVLCCQVIYLLL